jgi:L-ribulose-5-phosphate 4-epimerase
MAGEDGYIKFRCEWVKAGPLPGSSLTELNKWRKKLLTLGLMGAYPNGVGFGNISERIPGTNEFIITGSATGHLPDLAGDHYTKVTGFDLGKNELTCVGPIKASSESLSHAAIYETAPEIGAVIHVHGARLWRALLGKAPTTRKEAEYGTPEIARELQRLLRETDAGKGGVIVMGGHEDGVISFGRNLEEAGKKLLERIEDSPAD